MASGRKKKQKEPQETIIKISGMTEQQERLLVYAAVIIAILLLFAVEPGFFLGVDGVAYPFVVYDRAECDYRVFHHVLWKL